MMLDENDVGKGSELVTDCACAKRGARGNIGARYFNIFFIEGYFSGIKGQDYWPTGVGHCTVQDRYTLTP